MMMLSARTPFPRSAGGFPRRPGLFIVLAGTACALLVTGCISTTPLGADRVSTRSAYAQVEKNALSASQPSADAEWIINRYGLAKMAKEHPEEAVRQLHEHALRTKDRNILYALAELSYVAGDFVNRSVQPWDPRD